MAGKVIYIKPDSSVRLRKVEPRRPGKMPESSVMEEEYFPTISFSLDDFPDAEDWEVGKEYEVVLRVRQSSISMTKKGHGHVSFEVLAIGGKEAKGKAGNR